MRKLIVHRRRRRAKKRPTWQHQLVYRAENDEPASPLAWQAIETLARPTRPAQRPCQIFYIDGPTKTDPALTQAA